ncbi:MAG: DUF2254 family protein [Propionibacteriaceae bacterium]|nr:DUF2254 family protein [Propionibacteriaceae bacterium]
MPFNDRMTVHAGEAGFVAAIYEGSLRNLARSCGSPIEVLVGPGDHVLPGAPLLHADRMRLPDPEDFATSARRLIELGPSRTPAQDIRFCLARVSEMAVRAMSPGTNDPYTTVNAIHEITTALADLAGRPDPWPGVLADPGDELPVLVLPRPARAELIAEVFNELRPWVTSAPIAVAALTTMGQALMAASADREIAEVVRAQLRALAEQVENQPTLTGLDRIRLLDRITDVTG